MLALEHTALDPRLRAAADRRYDAAVPVSVIVVNWNGREHLDVCLGSLLRQTLAGVEVVLVDNASSDGSVALRARALRRGRARARAEREPRLRRRPQRRHPRRARALPAGAQQRHRGRAGLPGAAGRRGRPAGRAPGMFAPKILSFDDRGVLDNVGHLLYPDGLSRGRGRLEPDRGQYDREEEIVLPSGCAVLLRRAMLADVGLFDTDLFAYCDDTDLGLRARLAGWRCRSVPSRGRLPQVLGRQRGVLAAEGVPGRTQPCLGGGEVPAGAAADRQPAVHRPAPRRPGVGSAAAGAAPPVASPAPTPPRRCCSCCCAPTPPRCAACRARGASAAPCSAAGASRRGRRSAGCAAIGMGVREVALKDWTSPVHRCIRPVSSRYRVVTV